MQNLQAVKSVNAANLGAAASFSRPRLSNDNPFSEAQFKTSKYRPDFPERFDICWRPASRILAQLQLRKQVSMTVHCSSVSSSAHGAPLRCLPDAPKLTELIER